MKSIIIILMDSTVNSMNYASLVSNVKRDIISYLGSRNAESKADDEPMVVANFNITEEDVEMMYKAVDNDLVKLAVINNAHNESIVKGNIIELPAPSEE